MPRQNRTITLNWNSRTIQLLSQIAPQDPDLARVWWEQYAPEAYRAIMDSGMESQLYALNDEEEIARYLSDILLDNERQRQWYAAGLLLFFIGGYYWRQTGRRVAWRLIRTALNRTILRSSVDVNSLCEQLRSGAVSLEGWQNQMATMIKTSHLASAMVAAGGADGLTPDVMGIVESRINEQLSYLQEFANRIAGGLALDGNVCRIMKLYLSGARGVFYLVEGARMSGQGFTEYINVLGPTEDHCTGGGSCQEETAKGWQVVGTGVPIGSRRCLGNCLCHWQYRRLSGFTELGEPTYEYF